MADYATQADARYNQYRETAQTYIPYVSPDERKIAVTTGKAKQ